MEFGCFIQTAQGRYQDTKLNGTFLEFPQDILHRLHKRTLQIIHMC